MITPSEVEGLARPRSQGVASVNGVALLAAGATLSPEELRQRACTELLRQEAWRAGLLDVDDAPSADGVISEAAADAIEKLLAASLDLPEPSEEALRRHHAAHAAKCRGRGCERALSQVLVGQRSVGLQDLQQAQIGVVQLHDEILEL